LVAPGNLKDNPHKKILRRNQSPCKDNKAVESAEGHAATTIYSEQRGYERDGTVSSEKISNYFSEIYFFNLIGLD
jgi:hypothetical protein